MKKFIKYYDLYALKFLVAFLIVFTALYPKLPSVHIIRTWVYIRLEDFFILAAAVVWFVQLIRKKVTLPFWLGGSIAAYWLVGFISLVFSVLFIGPHLTNFFTHIAALEYLRRIEYMILFFIAFTTVKSVKDIRDYFIVLSVTLLAILLYGFGQKYYLFFWGLFPQFFEKYSYCFPSFQTGNEEFAKGIPLCLPKDARITSTFGGHYDLAAYLVFVLPVFLAVCVSVKKWSARIFTFLLYVGALLLLLFTASRTSYMAYLVAAIITLIIYKKKIFIVPVVILSIALLLIFSGSTAKRLFQTFRISSLVFNSQGQMVGEENLPSNLQNKVSKIDQLSAQQTQLQGGTVSLNLPASTVATNTATLKKQLTPEEARRLKLASGSFQISTVSGSFLIKKVLVYDISFTTRFQAEWPNAWNAFMRNPLLGSGYSTITLATDNDYLRALGETGFLGLFAMVLIFVLLGITLHEVIPRAESSFSNGFVFGVAGGVVGLALNGILIDVFEASKVAENLWILLGISAGGLALYKHKTIPYVKNLQEVLTSNLALYIYLLFILCTVFLSWTGNFFVANDFILLHQAALVTFADLPKYFLTVQNIFSGPATKVILVFLYNFFSFQPQGYHVFVLLLHLLAVIAVFRISSKLLKNRYLSFLTALLFLLFPGNSVNIFYLSNLSVVVFSVFILYAADLFITKKKQRSLISSIFIIIFIILAVVSYQVLPIYYLGSFILLLLLIILLEKSLKHIIKKKKFILPVITACVVVFVILYLNNISKIRTDWSQAGEITKNTLTFFRLDYENLSASSNLYFINTPLKQNSAKVFPAGLRDGLWFIYRERTPNIYEVNTISEANNLIKQKNTKVNYILKFDEKGNLSLVK